MTFINQYSMLWSAVLIFGLTAFFLLRRGFDTKAGVKLLGVGALLLVGWLVSRPQQANTVEYNQFQTGLESDKAVLLELQSPF